jgi:DNA-binding response OmpR family regulator
MSIRVAVIEDNRADTLLVRDALRFAELDFELREIPDAEQAGAYLAEIGAGGDCPDVVILDLNLPRGDGADVLAQLRSSPRCADVPVVVMTSSDSPSDRARVAEATRARYFRKPLELDAFLKLGHLVREMLESA